MLSLCANVKLSEQIGCMCGRLLYMTKIKQNQTNCIFYVYLDCLQSKMTAHSLDDEPKETLKHFLFSTNNEDFEDEDKLEIIIPEVSNKNVMELLAVYIYRRLLFYTF